MTTTTLTAAALDKMQSEVATAKGAALADMHNELVAALGCGREVVRFSDAATGRKRVEKLIATARAALPAPQAPAAAAETPEHCPHCGVHLSNGIGHHGQEVNGKIIRHAAKEFACLACGEEFGPELHKAPPEVRARIAEGVRGSWEDEGVAARRATRNGVMVWEGAPDPLWRLFKSVAEAFKFLGLPMKSHVKFRAQLKDEGALEAFGHRWALVCNNPDEERTVWVRVLDSEGTPITVVWACGAAAAVAAAEALTGKDLRSEVDEVMASALVATRRPGAPQARVRCELPDGGHVELVQRP